MLDKVLKEKQKEPGGHLRRHFGSSENRRLPCCLLLLLLLLLQATQTSAIFFEKGLAIQRERKVQPWARMSL